MNNKDSDQYIEENHSTVHTITDIKLESSSTINTLQQEVQETKSTNWLTYVWGDIYATDDPNQYSSKKKNVIILLVALSGLCGPLSSMMYMPGILAVAEDLDTSVSSVNATISAYVVFMGISVKFLKHALYTTTNINFFFTFCSHCFGLH